jgi:pimeloyl-ACP methyl ester carboxylesterase
MAGADAGEILIDGPWQHQDVVANGCRFHVAAGPGLASSSRMVVLLHGFAEFWWAWRHQLIALDAAGYAVIAMDLRGYGASDKTPRGYDARTVAADVAGVIRGLGHRQAVLVGHGWGGMAAWATAAYAPEQVRALAMVAAPHPLAYPWRATARELAFHQVPILPERRITAHGGAYVERLLRAKAAPGDGWPTIEDARRYRTALLQWPSPHCALEYQRMFVRDQLRSAGRDLRRATRIRTPVPLLSIHGDADPVLPAAIVARAGRYVAGTHTIVEVPGVGHFPHEEDPKACTQALLRWLDHLD